MNSNETLSTIFDVEVQYFIIPDEEYHLGNPHHYEFAIAGDWDSTFGIDVDEPLTDKQIERIAWLVSYVHTKGIIAGTKFTQRNIRTALGL